MKKILIVPIASFLIIFSGCEAVKQSVSNVNLFSIEQDAELGLNVSKEIESNPAQYPILSERGNEQVYGYIRETLPIKY